MMKKQVSAAVPSNCLFFKRQIRYTQTNDVLKNKQLDGAAVKAKKQGRFTNYVRSIVITGLAFLLTACLGTMWTGATMVYDRHSVYNSFSDYKLAAKAGHLLAADATFAKPGCLEIGR